MPTKQMCAACAHHACDCTAIIFRRQPALNNLSQAQAERIPGTYCRPAAWLQVFHALKTRGADYIGGEVRPV